MSKLSLDKSGSIFHLYENDRKISFDIYSTKEANRIEEHNNWLSFNDFDSLSDKHKYSVWLSPSPAESHSEPCSPMRQTNVLLDFNFERFFSVIDRRKSVHGSPARQDNLSRANYISQNKRKKK